MSESWQPTDCSPPGSSVHGIFQARVLEWGAMAFSEFPGPVLSIRIDTFTQVFPALQAHSCARDKSLFFLDLGMT